MRSWRLGLIAIAVILLSTCGGDDSEDGDAADNTTTTTSSTTTVTTTTRPDVPDGTTTSTLPEVSLPLPPDDGDTNNGDNTEPVDNLAEAPPPNNLKCLAGSAEGELLVEWDAPPDPDIISRVRVYVSDDGGPFITNRNLAVEQIDTSRSDGNRWAAAAVGLETGVPIRIAVTMFNNVDKESGWYFVEASYTGPGEACDGSGTPTLPPTTCTAGCEEDT